MPKITLTELIAALPALSQQELGLVRAAADRLLTPQASQSPLYAAVAAAAGVHLPYGRFVKTAAYKAWAKNEPEALRFISSVWPNLSKVQLNAMMIYLSEMLATDLRNRNVPVTVGTLAANLGSLPQVFDNNFPGYREAGLGHLVLKAMCKKPA